MIRKVFYILLTISLCLFFSCQRDTEGVDSYISPIKLHLVYKQIGENLEYTNVPKISLVNNTEQITYTFYADKKGNVILEKLLPGEYTINVTSSLTAQEMALVTENPEAQEGTLSGFLANVKMRLGSQPDLSSLLLMVSSSNPVIIKELYYAGSRTPSNMTYRNDGFYTIHNNSLDDVKLNDYYIASVENFGGKGIAGPQWPGEETGNYKNIYAMTIWKIVSSNSSYYLKGGEDATIAVMAAPHNKNADYNLNSPVDLSNADFEAYISNPSNSYPDFQAQNMKLIFWPSFSYLWRISVFGQGIVLIKATEEEMNSFETVTLPESFQDPFEDEEYWLCKKIPNKYIVDAVDLSENKSSTVSKRFPPVLDAGVASVEATYNSKSVIRKVQKQEGDFIIYQDTNNSSEDFEINDNPLSK
ncbi:MAG: DUF4876 domain-containing protein [Bacteroidales bacterium]|nr:DUF4876 domain-containing protein [Bacteroidales bacterium]